MVICDHCTGVGGTTEVLLAIFVCHIRYRETDETQRGRYYGPNTDLGHLKVPQRDKLSGIASEDLSHLERLGEELLNLTSTSHSQLVLLRQFIHTQDGNDILHYLKNLLDSTGNIVVLMANDVGVHDTGDGVEGIHSGVDAQLSNASRKHSGGIQVSEGGGWGRVSQVISRHIDSLHRGDGTLLSGGNTFLHATHVSSQGWLVTHSRWDTTQQGRHLRASLGEAEDVVDEEQHILSLLVTEVFSNSQSSQSHTGTGTWGLIHLTVHQGYLGGVILQGDDTRLNHFMVQIIALTGALSNTGKHRVATVSLGNVVNQFHDEYSLAHTGTTEQTCGTQDQ
ncbi:hypothetical protein E2C01_002395 [Portunus trituberculatus]|uniref:Uncharacterized protein n=1 Tax=Portunus trituberculatus TaxID=210409 RepID=A0A5B7CJJ9_PORTR|nr:hypothetical protein [Portunus trituberculatus]